MTGEAGPIGLVFPTLALRLRSSAENFRQSRLYCAATFVACFSLIAVRSRRYPLEEKYPPSVCCSRLICTCHSATCSRAVLILGFCKDRQIQSSRTNTSRTSRGHTNAGVPARARPQG